MILRSVDAALLVHRVGRSIDVCRTWSARPGSRLIVGGNCGAGG